MISLTECLLHVGYFLKCFACINSFNSHNNSMKYPYFLNEEIN